MSAENYQIRREEWEEVRSTLKEVRDIMLRVVERENARDDRIVSAHEKADLAHDRANKAHELINDLHTRMAIVEQRATRNDDTIGDWKTVAYRIIGGLILMAIAGAAGYFFGGP